MELVAPRNRDLPELLSLASQDDLGALADLITDFGNGRMALDSDTKRRIVEHQKAGTLVAISDLLAHEICAFGGNTIANAWRKRGVPYRELAMDVARELKGQPSKDDDVYSIEEIAISQAVALSSQGKAVDLPQKASDLGATLGPIVRKLTVNASTAAGSVLAGGVGGLVTAIGSRIATVSIPPVAIATAGVSIMQAASPASRITIPAVLQIAKIRRIQLENELAMYRKALEACR